MHCCDLGILQVFLANVWWDFFKAIGGVQSRPKAYLAELLNLIKWGSKQVGLPNPSINNLTMTMIRVESKSP
eukprot:9497492-Pyramimonas_sp.AAC.1